MIHPGDTANLNGTVAFQTTAEGGGDFDEFQFISKRTALSVVGPALTIGACVRYTF